MSDIFMLRYAIGLELFGDYHKARGIKEIVDISLHWDKVVWGFEA